MTNLRRLLANTMREQRRNLGMTQAQLAEMIDTAPTYIAMIELEKKWPSDKMLTKIASALSIDTPQFFSMTSYPEDSLKRLHKSVLTEFQAVIKKKLDDIKNI